ncbi:hypothetical protein [Paraburkholderia azotifigens]|uniref:Uncharacterized protein n=1 Tax=Paraburkholderia azotifigens TaxID=2057004 RepID=A0A5C6V7B1_9BURK|nr:hypothetical protein [Paraburkholderia azotifigens]TXC79645.1 hypothetical protein FRZ40_35390 [Paraburkholderia azotifigens]
MSTENKQKDLGRCASAWYTYTSKVLLALLVASQVICTAANADNKSTNDSNIVDYRPSKFSELAETPFFFSIGNKLKYGRAIVDSAPTVFEGDFSDRLRNAVYPSPNDRRAIVVTGKKLYLVEPGKKPYLILSEADNEVGSLHAPGAQFYRHYRLQWDPSSRYILIPRDRKQSQISQQFYSPDKALVRIDADNLSVIHEVIPVGQFRSSSFFLIESETVCFDFEVSPNRIIWKCQLGSGAKEVRSISHDEIQFNDGTTIPEKPFASYNGDIRETEIWLTHYGFILRRLQDGTVGIFRRDYRVTPYMRLNPYKNIKGHELDGLRQSGGQVLPGGRYAFLNIYGAALLLDSRDGSYKKLPTDTHCYINFNSAAHQDSLGVINHGSGWIDMKFTPAYPLRANYTE